MDRNVCRKTRKNIDESRKNMLNENHVSISKSTTANGLRELKITLKLASIDVDRMNNPRKLDLRQEYGKDFTSWQSKEKN